MVGESEAEAERVRPILSPAAFASFWESTAVLSHPGVSLGLCRSRLPAARQVCPFWGLVSGDPWPARTYRLQVLSWVLSVIKVIQGLHVKFLLLLKNSFRPRWRGARVK